jgi:hypothetical protein
MKMKGVFLGIVLGGMVSTGVAWGNLFEVKEAVEEALCRKLAMDYANGPSTFPVHAIAQLQICLAQSLKNTASPGMPGNFNIQSPSPSTNNVDTTLPTPPTPPTPPQSIRMK